MHQNPSSKTAPSAHGLSAHDRRMGLITLRCLTRDVLSRHCSHNEIEKLLASFAPAKVRGDAVPTISDAYAALLEVVNREGGQESPKPAPALVAPSPAPQPPALSESPRPLVLRLEIRIVSENASQHGNENIIAIPLAISALNDSGSGDHLRRTGTAA